MKVMMESPRHPNQGRTTPDWANERPVVLKDSAPNPKVPVAALGGPSCAGLIVWLFASAGVEVPLHVALEMSGLLALLFGYFCPARKN